QLLIQLGGTPTSTGWERWSELYSDVPRIHIGPAAFNDPSSGSTLHLVAGLDEALAALSTALADAHSDGAEREQWRGLFTAANRIAWQSVHAALDSDETPLREADVARQVIASLPPGSILALGNSLPIRLVDTFVEQQANDVRVLCQRGVNGIDGLV